jgi:mono/diheme cytochrome c family protein
MNARKLMVAALGLAMCGTAGVAFSQTVDIGKREFDSSCATCHGLSGKGNGPMAGYLAGRLPDLTTIAARNTGIFPFARIYDTIEGAQMLKGHGSREMPVWGPRYSEKAAEHYHEYYGPYDAAAFARGRMLALTEYVYRLQAK